MLREPPANTSKTGRLARRAERVANEGRISDDIPPALVLLILRMRAWAPKRGLGGLLLRRGEGVTPARRGVPDALGVRVCDALGVRLCDALGERLWDGVTGSAIVRWVGLWSAGGTRAEGRRTKPERERTGDAPNSPARCPPWLIELAMDDGRERSPSPPAEFILERVVWIRSLKSTLSVVR